METERNWFFVNLILPALPLLLRAIVKCFMLHIDWDVVNPSELWFVLAIMALLISQDIKQQRVPLDNAEKKKERHNRAVTYLVFLIVFVFFCGVSEIFYGIVVVDKNDKYYYTHVLLTLFSYLFAFLLIRFSCKTQKEFNLRAKLI